MKNILKEIGIFILSVLILLVVGLGLSFISASLYYEHPFWAALIMLLTFSFFGLSAGNIWRKFVQKKIRKRKFLWGTISGISIIIAILSFCCFFDAGCQGCQNFKVIDNYHSGYDHPSQDELNRRAQETWRNDPPPRPRGP